MLACGADDVLAAFYDFLIAIFAESIVIIAFIILIHTDFFCHYANNAGECSEENINDKTLDNNKDEENFNKKTSTLAIIKRTWIWILAIFLTFFVFLAVHPSITSQVVSIDIHCHDSVLTIENHCQVTIVMTMTIFFR